MTTKPQKGFFPLCTARRNLCSKKTSRSLPLPYLTVCQCKYGIGSGYIQVRKDIIAIDSASDFGARYSVTSKTTSSSAARRPHRNCENYISPTSHSTTRCSDSSPRACIGEPPARRRLGSCASTARKKEMFSQHRREERSRPLSERSSHKNKQARHHP